MGRLPGLGLLAMLTLLGACRTVPVVAKPAEKPEPVDENAILGPEDYWSVVARIPDRLKWLEEELWETDGGDWDVCQSWSMRNPLALQPFAQRPAGVLEYRPFGSKSVKLDLRPGVVTCVQFIGLDDVENATDDTVKHIWAVSIVDAEARRSRLVFIPGSKRTSLHLDDKITVFELPGAAFTGLTYDYRRRRMFVLDAARFEVWRVDDGDRDRIPELVSRGSVVLPDLYRVKGTRSPPLSVAWLEKDGVRGLLPTDSHRDGLLVGNEKGIQGQPFWQDTDDDGVMDRLSIWQWKRPKK